MKKVFQSSFELGDGLALLELGIDGKGGAAVEACRQRDGVKKDGGRF